MPAGGGLVGRARRAAAHAGAAGLAELGDRQALAVGVGVLDLPRHGALAEAGSAAIWASAGSSKTYVAVNVSSLVNVRPEEYPPLGAGVERAGDRTDVALADGGVDEVGVDDALLDLAPG